MKILFVCLTPVLFDVETPEREPLGGTESCACYLARQLAAGGHDVSLVSRRPSGTTETLLGVRHLPETVMADAAFIAAQDFDAAIAVSNPLVAPVMKALSPRTLNICWQHMFPDAEDVANLARATDALDCAVFVSDFQRTAFRFRGASQIIGNGIAPAFENMFATADELRAAKENRAVYTSMPFRGLDLLVDVMERTQATKLDIYSAMRTYQGDDNLFLPLYERAKANPRVTYHGATGQRELARRLRHAAFLAYPCIFRETYCIAAVEAIAAGLKVISTDLGPLAQTSMGFADLLPLRPGMKGGEIVDAFVPLLEKNVAAFQAAPQAWAEDRFAQMRTVNQLCSWRARAAEWEAFLAPAIAAKRG